MDNKITILGVVHLKKLIKENKDRVTFMVSYLSNKDVKIRNIKAILESEISDSITNGMVVIIDGQLLYSEEDDKFIIKVDKILPIKDRSGLAEDTIIIQYGNTFNNVFIGEDVEEEDGILYTHPKPISGNIKYTGALNKESLYKLDLINVSITA